MGEHHRSYVYEGCEVRWCCTAAAAFVPLLYYARMLLEFRKKCGLGSSLVVFRMARPHNCLLYTSDAADE